MSLIRPLPSWLLPLTEAVVRVAMRQEGRAVKMQETAREMEIEVRYLERLYQCMGHAGILRGERGSRGGQRLTRDASEITVGDLYRGGRIKWKEEPHYCPQSEAGKKVEAVFALAESRMIAELDAITIQDLVNQASDRRSVEVAA